MDLSFIGTWSGSMHKAHIILQEPQALVLMLHTLDFYLSGTVALHLNNSTAELIFVSHLLVDVNISLD